MSDWSADRTVCPCCEGKGTDWGRTCAACGGSGRNADVCEKCDSDAVGFSEDGEWLCEDCLFEAQCGEMGFGPNSVGAGR